jgi:CRP-like cAMP-binding protein
MMTAQDIAGGRRGTATAESCSGEPALFLNEPRTTSNAASDRAVGRTRPASLLTQELAIFELFKGLDRGELDALRSRMRVVALGPGVEVVAPGGRDDGTVYFVLVGRVQVVLTAADGRLVRLAEIGAGEVFGDIAAIDGLSRSAGVETLTTCRLGAMKRDVFLDMVTGSPKLALAMMQALTRRAREQNLRLFENAVLDLRHRIVAELARCMRVEGGVGFVRPAPRHVDLANTLRARRESVAREFGRMTREGLLVRDDRGLVVPDPEALRRHADVSRTA